MRHLGQMLVMLALVGGGGFSVLALGPGSMKWATVGAGYSAAVLLCGMGIALWRRGGSRGGEFGLDTGFVEERLNRVVTRLQDINTNSETIDVQEVGRMIDGELAAGVRDVSLARESLSRRLDPDDFSGLMGSFDDGRRCLLLARTASEAGRIEELWESLGTAEQRLSEAHSLLRQICRHNKHPSRN